MLYIHKSFLIIKITFLNIPDKSPLDIFEIELRLDENE